ncbi:deoxyribonuclease [Betaproteobacteria bacterium]|nr:deoxyribonuclease [Betaproteobacteria bacterium]GHU16829.1 deoxyribonuclease [Betaproteobacteria bacterium]
MLIDTHIHLDAAEFDADRAAVLAQARAGGVGGFVAPAVERAGFARVLALAEREPDVFPALGIHPLYVDAATDADLAALDHLLAQGRGVAVGEIGLDHFVAGFDAARQAQFFLAQLDLARRHGLPVILHLRRAVDEVLEALRRVRVCGGIAHAFNGSLQQAQMFIGLGFKLGFGGEMSFPGSTRIRRLAAELPLDAIVLETDAPDIAPVWARGERNVPVNLARYAGILAGLREMALADIIKTTTTNARAALALPQR